MEQQPQSSSSLFQLNIDAGNAGTLRSAGSWARILGILGIIFGLLFIAVGFLVQNAVNNSYRGFDDNSYRSNVGVLATGAMAAYVIMGVLTIIGSIFALSFGSKVSAALRTNDPNTLRSGFAGARNYFAFWAILMIIGLLFCIIAIASGGFKTAI
jgi:hypothetical protein